MEYRKFGATDITVSAIGFGCHDASKPTKGLWGDEYIDRMCATVNRAIDMGINCFDTAPHYGLGDSERMLGRALGARRKDVVLVTKCGLGWQGSEVDRPKGRDGRREYILPLVEQSLERMQTDYIDVLLMHYPDPNTPFEETMETLDSVVQQGKARYVGVSNYSLDQIKEMNAIRRVDAAQYHYNAFDRRVDQELIPYCEEQDIGVMGWGALASGLLSGTCTVPKNFTEVDWRMRGDAPEVVVDIFDDSVWQRNVNLVDDLKPIAKSLGKTMPQLALRWVLANPAVSVSLVGILDDRELEEDLGALEWALSAEDMRQIDAVFAKYGVNTHPPQYVNP